MDLNKELGALSEQWKEIMAQCKAYNECYQTYTLSHIQKQEKYGYSCRVYAPYGLALDDLEKYQKVIESGLKCTILCDIPDHKEFAMLRIVKPTLVKCNEILFSPHPVKPYELYMGVNISGDPIIFNCNDTPHAMIGGETGSGKNGPIDHAVTSLIHYCEPTEVEFYMFQGAKNDMVKYKNCEHVKAFVMGDCDKFLIALTHLKQEMQRRNEMLEPMVAAMKGTNIFDYNKSNSKQNRLSYIYAVIDEFASLMPDTCDSKDLKNTKMSILDCLEDIARYGRAMGVFLLIAHQKPSKEQCPSFLKNMCTIRICFSFNDDVGPRIVLGEKYASLAVGLPQRRAYYITRGKCDLLFTTNLTGRIEPFIKPKMKIGHKTVFDIIKSEDIKPSKPKTYRQTPGKTPKIDFSKVEKTPEQIIQENISKIPNFVPWEPIKGGKIKK
jgi:hypothetical protein